VTSSFQKNQSSNRKEIRALFLPIIKGNVFEHGMSHHLQGIHMSVMKRKKKNTDLERQKKLQREKDAKKKQMRNQLPAKQGKR